MPDLPDWWQGFQLVGSDITINVNIEATGVTLPIDIAAVTADLDVTIIASDVTISFNFADQSVAVFDAAKWFAHNAEQLAVRGLANVPQNSDLRAIRYTVPAGKTLFVCGLGYRTEPLTAAMWAAGLDIRIGASIHMEVGSVAGDAVLFDVPLRFTTGQVVDVHGHQYSSMANVYFRVELWGYLEGD